MNKCYSFLATCCLLFTVYSFSQGTWTQKANFGGTARSYIPNGFSIGQYGYAGTGYDGSNYYQDFWQWNSVTNTWTQKANFGGGMRRYTTAVSINGKGYMGMGEYNSSNYADWWAYDTATNTWTQKANFPGIARIAPVAFEISGMGYVGGGAFNTINTTFYNDFFQYNPSTNTWTAKTGFSTLGRNAAIDFSINGKGYMGTGYTGTWSSDFWEYDPVGDAWTQKASLPASGRTVAGAFAIGPRGYVGGGYTGSGDVSDFWEYHPTTNAWTAKANIGAGGWSQMVSYTINGKGYFTLGRISGSPTAVNWEYDPGLFTGMDEETNAPDLSFYPNPSSGKLSISTSLDESELAVYTLAGEEVYRTVLHELRAELDLSMLPNGVYLIKQAAGSKSISKKLVIQH